MFVYSIDSVNRCNDTSQNDDWTCVTKVFLMRRQNASEISVLCVTGPDPEKNST